MNQKTKVLVIGAGLAGSEAALYLAERKISVVLLECKSIKLNPAQKLNSFAELVCTNSLKSIRPETGHGLLKYEMEKLGSIVLSVGKKHAVPAGDALAVDREKFSREITNIIQDNKFIQVVKREAGNPIELMKEYDCDYCIIATGPLTTSALEEWIKREISGDDFYFYDAIAPVVDADSLDLSQMYFKDRHHNIPLDKEADYLNIPLNKEQYENFITELVKAEKVPSAHFEEYKFFESCLPIDIMAERGIDTARFSCMKPIGLELDNGKLPYAVVQLRRENLLGSAYNMVGFQTRLKYPEQKRVFSMLPGMQEVQFLHLGSVHRNSFINAKKLLNKDLSSKKFTNIYFAGQICGVEGYTESASMGLYVADNISKKISGENFENWPLETAIGALINYVMTVPKPTPSNINFGLLPPVEIEKKRRMKRHEIKKLKKTLVANRAREVFNQFRKIELPPKDISIQEASI
ncbi:MAG: methylenetetrahydrofolate--tRNA-(uracil(54)-C(5))-methyltransferase (FADH(2)-oxidizing) TrmFO [Halobacteriovoraceae bacterium]|nr:methylenetetrahydrofolate--tRNA-(uracil(54)-C(5))-methyltransferase (FADH(2)-oxidizing) TrmFO [Halobacteriovoraceae bacterium]